VIIKHGFLAYLPTKKTLLRKRLKLLNNQKEYATNIGKTQYEYQKCMSQVTNMSIEFLDIDRQTFQ